MPIIITGFNPIIDYEKLAIKGETYPPILPNPKTMPIPEDLTLN